MIFDPFDPNESNLDKARKALQAVIQYDKDWKELGVNRVHKYFDTVEGDWLENWEEINVEKEKRNDQ